MWMEKLESGVLRVMTPLGPRYIQPSFWERVYLLWMFRHFRTLPQVVLTGRQQRLIEKLCAEQRFVSLPYGWREAPILGTVERRPVVESFVVADAAADVPATVTPLPAESRQRS